MSRVNEDIILNYQKAFFQLHGRFPEITMTNGWFHIENTEPCRAKDVLPLIEELWKKVEEKQNEIKAEFSGKTFDRLTKYSNEIRCLCGQSTSGGIDLKMWYVYPNRFIILKDNNMVASSKSMEYISNKYDEMRDDFIGE